MLFSQAVRSLTCFLLLSTSAYATLSVRGNHIPLDPEEDLAKTPVCPATKESDFQQGRQLYEEGVKWENEGKLWSKENTLEGSQKAKKAYKKAIKNYQEAFEPCKKAAASGHLEALMYLGYLYERSHLGEERTIEERRLIDALAAYYIEKGGNAQIEGHPVHFHFLEEIEEDEDQQPPSVSLATIQEDENLTDGEKFFKIGEWYEQQRKPGETIAQKRLRYAYAGRYYEEAALWHFYPKAYTSLGHMYYFGKGIDISDMPLSARLQAQMYYEAGVFNEYIDQPDAEAQFMMGFLSEQEQTPDSAKNANSHFQAAADQNHSPAAFRLGVRYEQGQEDEIDVPTYYKKAEAYYTKALNAPKPPAFISLLIAMPDDLSNKVTLVKKLQDNSEDLDTPTYGLIDIMFCEYIRKSLPQTLMPYWIDLSLTRYGQDHALSYKKDPSKTVERVKGIAGELSGTRAAQIIPDLTAHEQKFLNIENSKSMPQNAAAQLIRLLTIKQRLGQEDDKWKESPGAEMKSHVETWLQEVQPLVEGINNLPKSFEGDSFLAGLTKRIQDLPTASHTLDPSLDLWPQGYLDSLGQELTRIKKEAQTIFGDLRPYQRSLPQQLIIYKNVQEIKRHLGESLSPELLQDILLARTLMMESSKDEDQSEKIIKHFQSARALRGYAASHNLSIDQARTELDQKARQLLFLLSPQLHDFSIIGYDIIIALLQDAPSQEVWAKASDDYRKRLLLTLNQGDLDNSWIKAGGSFDLSYLSGKSKPTKNTLTRLYAKAKSYVDGKKPLLSPEKPTLKLAAVTYEDPHVGLYGNIVPDTFKDLQAEAQQLYEGQTLGMPEQAIYASLLDREILKIRDTIGSLNLSGIDIGEFNSIIETIEYANISAPEKSLRKQNLLFMLKKSADWDNPEVESITLAAQGIINGTEGRCSDGQANFFQDWILEYTLNNLTENLKLDTSASLKISLSLLLQNYKNVFIQKHTSPFLMGGEEWSVSESRTAMELLLTQMLRLPLSLTGSYNTICYPSYALHALENSENSLRIKNSMKRFLKGGEVTYNDFRVTQDALGTSIYHDVDADGTPEPYQVKIPFEGLTLKTLGRVVREAFIPLQNKSHPLPPLPGLLHSPRITFSLPEKFVQDFLQYDPILASFYSTFMDSVYTKGNIFFDSKAAYERGTGFQNILKDAAILRILEVGGYVEVPEGFYGSVKEGWHFE